MAAGRNIGMALCGLLCMATAGSHGQTQWQDLQPDWLQVVMPAAHSFTPIDGGKLISAHGEPAPDGEPPLLGYVFATPAWPPEEPGFSGPIDVLLGMDLVGRLTGIKVLHYEESYKHIRGDFITDSGFPAQFVGKLAGEEFRVGHDIDGMARATISSWAMAQGVRNAARRVAASVLPDSEFALTSGADSRVLEDLQASSWEQLIANGFVRQFDATLGESELQIAVAYMGHYRLGELLIGGGDYSSADRTASSLVPDGHMMLLGLNGNVEGLQQQRLAAMQEGIIYPNPGERVVFAGTAGDGKIAGQARLAIAFYIDAAIDIFRPFTLIYDTSARPGEFTDYASIDYRLPQSVMDLMLGPETTPPPTRWRDLSPWALLAALLLLVLNRHRLPYPRSD